VCALGLSGEAAGCIDTVHMRPAAVHVQVSGWQGARELHSDHGSVVVYRGMTDCFVRTGESRGLTAYDSTLQLLAREVVTCGHPLLDGTLIMDEISEVLVVCGGST
jgi:hypothetical protein